VEAIQLARRRARVTHAQQLSASRAAARNGTQRTQIFSQRDREVRSFWGFEPIAVSRQLRSLYAAPFGSKPKKFSALSRLPISRSLCEKNLATTIVVPGPHSDLQLELPSWAAKPGLP
jgi:hypothetical protein